MGTSRFLEVRTHWLRTLRALCFVLATSSAHGLPASGEKEPAARSTPEERGSSKVERTRPPSFPHRIVAACDFEGQTPDYGWFGAVEKTDLPVYPGNANALRGEPAKDVFAHLAGVNPVPGPRLGKQNGLYFRYKLDGTQTAQVQHFNLTKEDNHHVVVSGLAEGKWSELALDFTARSRRNDGSPGAMEEGDRMDDFKVLLGKTNDGKRYGLLIDDFVLFANDPALPPDSEPFPNRVIFLAAFDTGEKEKYWPGDFEIVEKEAPPGAFWRVARAVDRKEGGGKWIRLGVEPPRPVGARSRLRFRYHSSGAKSLTVQVFNATVQDNHHVRLTDLEQGAWRSARVDLTKDSKRNDGSSVPLAAGDRVDDIFFFVEPLGGGPTSFFVDEVVLYDGRDST